MTFVLVSVQPNQSRRIKCRGQNNGTEVRKPARPFSNTFATCGLLDHYSDQAKEDVPPTYESSLLSRFLCPYSFPLFPFSLLLMKKRGVFLSLSHRAKCSLYFSPALRDTLPVFKGNHPENRSLFKHCSANLSHCSCLLYTSPSPRD